ncbi:MAG: hypothetical protein K8T10_15305 [Candidatus Eremiobacteraeota bacterium]|nr:hypothetical protein [Candidatus Eremiobacteraeota bacterium]
MKYELTDLGPKIRGDSVHFKIQLPRIDKEARVLVIGSFCDWEPENGLALRYDSEKDVWKGVLEDFDEGEFEYAYLIKTDTWYSNPSLDPYAKMTGKNGYSCFSVPSQKPARLDSFRVPDIKDLNLYYVNLDDFNKNFEGVKNRVRYYFSQLGINGIIFSPWVGFDHDVVGERIPTHFFAPDSTYGTSYDLKVMVNECHRAGIAVIMDIDFSAVSTRFGFNTMYPLFENKPMLGRMDETGKKIYMDFKDEMAIEFVNSVCRFWLDEFNVDGFRFLNTNEIWDTTDESGFRSILKKLYNRRTKDQGEQIYLFAGNPGHYAREILNDSYANGVDNTIFTSYIHRMAENRTLPSDFRKIIDINQEGFSEESKIGEDTMENTALNFIEDDWHHSLIVKMGQAAGEFDRRGYPVGDRKNHWWKMKPYIIAMYLSNGIPVIHNGQEIGENRYLPDDELKKAIPRPISWHFLADFAGKDMYRFHQKLIHVRDKFKAIRGRNFFHYFTDPSSQIIVFKRYLDDESIIVAINFSNESNDVVIPFPSDGIWHEYLDDFPIKVKNRQALIKVPARYGRIFYRD